VGILGQYGNSNLNICCHYRAMKETSQLIFNFTGGATCAHATGNVERNVVLTMFCNEYAQSDSQPQFVSEDPRDCTYYISWPRRDLCPHRSVL